jgi:hypothetical protein
MVLWRRLHCAKDFEYFGYCARGWIGPAEESESKSYIATEGRDYEADEMR